MHPVFLLGFRLVWPKATVFEIVIMGSNPISPAKYTRVTQWTRVLRYERGSRRFESFHGCQVSKLDDVVESLVR